MSQFRLNTQVSDCQEYLNTHKLVTQQDLDTNTDTSSLQLKVQQLHYKLAQAKQKELKLKVVNNQLSNMLVSSSQASHRKTIEFIAKVQDILQAKFVKNKNNLTKQSYFTAVTSNCSKPQRFLANQLFQKHEKRWSNFQTRSSVGQVEKTIEKQNRVRANQKQNRLQSKNRMEIRERMESIKRIEKQMKRFG